MKSSSRGVDVVAAVLVFIGAINWGLIGIFDFNVLTWLFGHLHVLIRIIYIFIGLAGLWMLFCCSGCLKK